MDEYLPPSFSDAVAIVEKAAIGFPPSVSGDALAGFAAWPLVYAAAFSGFYWAMLLVLFALFFRPVGFKYRSLVADTR